MYVPTIDKLAYCNLFILLCEKLLSPAKLGSTHPPTATIQICTGPECFIFHLPKILLDRMRPENVGCNANTVEPSLHVAGVKMMVSPLEYFSKQKCRLPCNLQEILQTNKVTKGPPSPSLPPSLSPFLPNKSSLISFNFD
jgi:hypothetical protein